MRWLPPPTGNDDGVELRFLSTATGETVQVISAEDENEQIATAEQA